MAPIQALRDRISISFSIDLPPPDAVPSIVRDQDANAQRSRPVPDIADTGRITFGASCRKPLRK